MLRLSICVLVWYDNALDSEEYYLQVKSERPVLDIPDVSSYPFFHLPYLFCLSPETCYLCISCYARLAEMTYHVFVDYLTVLLSMLDHVRTGTDDTHVTSQDIEKLWQFVYVCLSHEIAEREFSRVVLCCLFGVAVVIDVHGTEFQTVECRSVDTCPLLFEEQRPRTL